MFSGVRVSCESLLLFHHSVDSGGICFLVWVFHARPYYCFITVMILDLYVFWCACVKRVLLLFQYNVDSGFVYFLICESLLLFQGWFWIYMFSVIDLLSLFICMDLWVLAAGPCHFKSSLVPWPCVASFSPSTRVTFSFPFVVLFFIISRIQLPKRILLVILSRKWY